MSIQHTRNATNEDMGMGSAEGVMSPMLQRLDVIDKTLGQLDSIQSSINNVRVKASDIEVKVKELEKKSVLKKIL